MRLGRPMSTFPLNAKNESHALSGSCFGGAVLSDISRRRA